MIVAFSLLVAPVSATVCDKIGGMWKLCFEDISGCVLALPSLDISRIWALSCLMSTLIDLIFLTVVCIFRVFLALSPICFSSLPVVPKVNEAVCGGASLYIHAQICCRVHSKKPFSAIQNHVSRLRSYHTCVSLNGVWMMHYQIIPF